MSEVRILHISDLHMTPTPRDASQDWRRDLVLGEAWKANLETIVRDRRPDLICFTGDVAQAGKTADYKNASPFVADLLAHTGVSRDRLFIVPGNHDVDRDIASDHWEAVRAAFTNPDMGRATGPWLYDGRTPKSQDPAAMAAVLKRRRAFLAWLKAETLDHCLPTFQAMRPGFRHRLDIPGHSTPLWVLGLDTAWLAGDNHDQGKLCLTEDQVERLAHGLGDGFRLALAHHPLHWLHDHREVLPSLTRHVDLLLCGHVHKAGFTGFEDQGGSLNQRGVGCLYEHDTYPNGIQVIDIRLDAPRDRPLKGIWFRSWSKDSRAWNDDNTPAKECRNGRLDLAPPRQAVRPTPVHPKAADLFVARQRELDLLWAALLPEDGADPKPCVVHGGGGVGKSYLVDRFYTLHRDRFPGGYKRVTVGRETPASVDTLLDLLAAALDIKGSGPTLVEAVTDRLSRQRTLVQVENVDTRDLAEAMVGLVRRLDGAALVVTARPNVMGGGQWAAIPLSALAAEDGLELLRLETGWEKVAVETPECHALVDALGGHPLALHIVGARLRKGYKTPGEEWAYLKAKKLAVRPPDLDDPLWLDDPVRAVLASSFDLSLDVLRAAVGDEAPFQGFLLLGHAPEVGFSSSLGSTIAGIDGGSFDVLMEDAVDLSLVLPNNQGGPRWKLHTLLLEHLRNRAKDLPPPWNRITDWLRSRGGAFVEQEWNSFLGPDAEGLPSLVESLPTAFRIDALETLGQYTRINGPYHVWSGIHERGTDLEFLPPAKRRSLLFSQADLTRRMGDPSKAEDLARRLLRIEGEPGQDRDFALAFGVIADILEARGDLDEALRIRKQDLIPVYEKLGDMLSRAVTMGQIADILQARGDLDEALRIRKQDQIPVFEKLGDMRSRAVTMGQIADILQARGDLDEALRIRKQEEIPVFEKLGDIRSRAVAMGKIADILQTRGDFDEVLRIRKQDQIPVYEKLGDVRERTVTMGQIADILQARGDLDEALRIRKQEEIPVFEKLGDIRSRAVTMGKIADVLQARGDLDEALRIRKQEEIPVFEKLGDVRERAVTMSKIADILEVRGDLDEALRIRKQEEVPVFEKLGDIRSHAVSMGKIANILQARGDFDEALRIRKQDQIPVYEKLGYMDGIAATSWAMATNYLDRGNRDEAIPLIEKAYRIFEKLGRLDGLCVVGAVFGQVLIARGEAEEARHVFQRSVDGYRKLGLVADAERVEALMTKFLGGAA
jgi:tetratricopeptide (TPR) repeat protein/predicted phosphodiesterase